MSALRNSAAAFALAGGITVATPDEGKAGCHCEIFNQSGQYVDRVDVTNVNSDRQCESKIRNKVKGSLGGRSQARSSSRAAITDQTYHGSKFNSSSGTSGNVQWRSGSYTAHCTRKGPDVIGGEKALSFTVQP